MKTLRTFIAVPIKVGNHFLLAREEMMERLAQERITWVDPESYHVTIRFLGDTSPALVEKIRQSMKDRLDLGGNVLLNLGLTGSFGPQNRPRVVWVGFKESSLFERVHGQLEAALKMCGIGPAEKPFRPHLTLGRVREIKDVRLYYKVISSLRDHFSGKVRVDRLVLFKSELGFGPPVYTPLEEVCFSDQDF